MAITRVRYDVTRVVGQSVRRLYRDPPLAPTPGPHVLCVPRLPLHVPVPGSPALHVSVRYLVPRWRRPVRETVPCALIHSAASCRVGVSAGKDPQPVPAPSGCTLVTSRERGSGSFLTAVPGSLLSLPRSATQITDFRLQTLFPLDRCADGRVREAGTPTRGFGFPLPRLVPNYCETHQTFLEGVGLQSFTLTTQGTHGQFSFSLPETQLHCHKSLLF